MKNSLLLFVGAAALSLASCSQEKTADTTTTTTTTPADATAVAMPDTAAYRTRSQRVSEKFITDMKITDPAMQGKVRTAYYNRSKRYGEMKSKYASDTTGMAAAMNQYNTDTDAEFKSVITDPAQYQSYQSSRSNYDEANYMDDASSSTTMPADNSGAVSSSTDMTSGAAVKESKTKMENGAKIKLKDDGTVKTKGDLSSAEELKDSKTKLEDGTKIKIKGDGTVKVKDANGDKTKM
jgi:hypothetical protein